MARRRFEFRLARLLRVREVAERMARDSWSQAQSLALAADDRRQEKGRDLAQSREDFARALRSAPHDAASLLVDQRAMDGQTAALARAAEEALTRQAQAQTSREAWRETERDRRALDELRKRASTRHRAEVAAQDQAEMDEIALQRGHASRTSVRPERGRTDAPWPEPGTP